MNATRKRRAPWLFLPALVACGNSTGGVYPPRASVAVTDTSGAQTAAHCVRLPLLLGSHTQDRLDVGGAFTMILFTSNQALDVELEGASFDTGPTHSVTATELENAYSSELRVVSDSGDWFFVHITSGCSS